MGKVMNKNRFEPITRFVLSNPCVLGPVYGMGKVMNKNRFEPITRFEVY